MIKKTSAPQGLSNDSVFSLRINDAGEDGDCPAAFYTNGAGGIIAVTSGGACTVTGEFESEELSAFLCFTRPASILYGGAGLTLSGYSSHKAVILKRLPRGEVFEKSADFDFDLSSDKVYAILKATGAFNLPPYEYFAVNYCRRKNRGRLICAAKEDAAAAIAFICGDAAMLNGVASVEKGAGSRVLRAVLKRLADKTVFAVAEEKTAPFYEKNGFMPVGGAIYYEKTEGEENELFYL